MQTCTHGSAANCSSYARQETREGAMKSINREYYYIDYRRAIDAVKYRIHRIDERIKRDAKPTTEKFEYNCKQCKERYTTMDVVDHIDWHVPPRDSGFLCKRCDFPLSAIDADKAQENDGEDEPALFNKLFGPLLDLMQQIDLVTIPAIEGKDALESAVELPRDKDVNPGAKHEAVTTTIVKPTAVKGTNNTVEKIEVQIATDSEYNEAARAAEKARQEKIAAQNLLPEWHTKSTVTNQGYDGSIPAAKAITNGAETPSIKVEAAGSRNGKEQNLDDVFAALEAEAQRKREEEEEEEDDEDDEEDEFEDVAVGTPNGLPDAKRVKLESSAAPTPTNMATPAISTGDGGDESDEDEFVDV